jgi:hypothetical protein
MINNNNNNKITLDNNNNIVYNTSMTNNNTINEREFTMTNTTNDVRVIKHINGSYDVHANFPIVQDALDYMRRMGFANDSWYIVNADGVRLRLNNQGKLTVFNSLIG